MLFVKLLQILAFIVMSNDIQIFFDIEFINGKPTIGWAEYKLLKEEILKRNGKK